MEYIKEHLYITLQDGLYFLNADSGYKFYDNTVEENERTYWSKRSLGFDKSLAYNFDAIDEETVARMEEIQLMQNM